MGFLIIAFAFLIDIAVSAAFLWLGMKVASVYAGMPNGGQYCGYQDLVKVCVVAAAISLVPYIGLIGSWVGLFYMLYKVTEAGPVELLIMVFISRAAAALAFILLVP